MTIAMTDHPNTLTYETYDATIVAQLRAGGPDAYDMAAERTISDGRGNPCRCCLRNVPKRAGMLVAAARPFAALGPYSETGPIFLCADDCAAWDSQGVPPILTTSPDYLIKGYGEDGRIIYGTGKIVPTDEVSPYCAGLLRDPGIDFVDVRSATNNCFLTRVRR